MKNILPLLPVGQQDFEQIRSIGMIYVDKTELILNILNSYNTFFFLSRPRRFGKSLLINTLKAIFEGKKDLFDGLFISDKWNFEAHPVIHLDFSTMGFREIGLKIAIEKTLESIAKQLQIELLCTGIGLKFAELMQKLHEKTGKQVVVLIDEYDKPITDVLEFGKTDKANEHRDVLRSLYSAVKGNSEHIRFFFLTGIARFAKVSIFSDLNNLTDLSIESDYHNLLGYTQIELETSFEPHLNYIATERSISITLLLDEIRVWYNGFSWNGKETVYNPYSILRFLSAREFHNFWFDSGTPKFLIELLKKASVYNMSNMISDPLTAGNLDIDNVTLVPLFFQTGYLTIKEIDKFGRYHLDYPNKEVEQAMLQHILMAFAHDSQKSSIAFDITTAIEEHNIELLIKTVNTLFASIPYQLFDANQEKYFHAILFLSLKLCGFFIESEVSVSTGRIDAIMHYQNRVYIFEFKLNDSADSALKQIHEKGYYKRFLHSGKEVFLLGISFSGKTKEVAEWKLEQI